MRLKSSDKGDQKMFVALTVALTLIAASVVVFFGYTTERAFRLDECPPELDI